MGPGGPGAGPGWGHMGRMGGIGGGPGMMGGGPGFDMGAAAAGRLAAFKAQLKITPDQETAWKAYETTVTQQAQSMQQLRDQFHAQWQNAKPGQAAPDFAAQRQAMFAQRQANWETQRKAMQDLYAVLTPEQQSLVTGGWGGGPRRR
jgi:Spy/CpxP family protein refolding chaperone